MNITLLISEDKIHVEYYSKKKKTINENYNNI